MLITRDILNEAIREEKPLFHNGDEIDENVLYDLFYAPPKEICTPKGKKQQVLLISKEVRSILCANLIGYKSPKIPYDTVFYNKKCEVCGEITALPITKAGIINKTFRIKSHVNVRMGTPTKAKPYSVFHPATYADIFKIKYGDSPTLFVCKSCISKFESDTACEAKELLERSDKFEWYQQNKDSGDWKTRLFYEDPFSVGRKITAINDDCWADEECQKWEQEIKDREEKARLEKELELQRIREGKLTPSQEIAMNAYREGKSFFLTGKAGTGKSYITRCIIEDCKIQKKNIMICAPTGIAAINVGGVTLHSAFAIPVGIIEPYSSCNNRKNLKIISKADIILIDEISMCRLDAFNYIMRTLAGFPKKQIILVGDFYQLPPVLTSRESEVYMRFYKSVYSFDSEYWKRLTIETIELSECMRTQDTNLVKCLDNIRVGIADFSIFKSVENTRANRDAISLCTTNAQANGINETMLSRLKGPIYTFEGEKSGKYSEQEMPTEQYLRLGVGARVLMLANKAGYANGSLGTVTDFGDDGTIGVAIDGGDIVRVEKFQWDEKEYVLGTEDGETKLEQNTVGTFSQYPMKLAWAITIHKAQGQTYEKVNIESGRFFCEGQMYVALSRCKSLEGMNITGNLSAKDLLTSKRVVEFMNNKKGSEQGNEEMVSITIPKIFEEHILRYIKVLKNARKS